MVTRRIVGSKLVGGALGRCAGRSGQGPGSVSTVYHFADLTAPRTLALFATEDGPRATECIEARVLEPAGPSG